MDHDPPVATLRAVLLRWVRDRLKAGETQERVASRLGITRSQLNQILSGYVPSVSRRARSFRIENIDEAAKSLDLSLGNFLHELSRLAVELDTEERIVAQPVDGAGSRVLADPETAERASQSPEAPATPKKKPPR